MLEPQGTEEGICMVGEGQQGPHGGFESQSRVRRMPVAGVRWGGDHRSDRRLVTHMHSFNK